MSSHRSTSIGRCSPTQLKALLGLAAGDPGDQESLLTYIPDREQLQHLLSELCADAEQAGEVLLAMACARDASLEVLSGLKEFAKRLSKKAATEPQRTAATFLYHLAIAAAIGQHSVNLSSRPSETRLELYEDLATALAGDPMGHVFRKAIDCVFSERP